MEKARFLFQICVGVVILSEVMEIAPSPAYADFDPNGPGGIIGVSHRYILLENGEVWWWNHPIGWERNPILDPPIPTDEIAYWDVWSVQDALVVTVAGVCWLTEGGEGWVNCGSPPEGTQTKSSKWSRLKTNYEK